MLRLKIDGHRFEPDTRTSARLVYNAAELASASAARNTREVEVKIAAGPAADRLFGNAGSPLTAERFNAGEHRAELECDGAVLFSGKAAVAGTERCGGELLYRLRIKSEPALWAHSAAMRKIAAAGVSFSGELTPDDICRGWSDDRAVKFFPVSRTTAVEEPSGGVLRPMQSAASTDDYWPFISVSALTEAIFADAGYTVESRFFEGELFRSLYMSGGYAGSSEAAARKRSMDFLAGRTADAQATADAFGRVNLTAAIATHSTGNIVDTVESYISDKEGRLVPSGFFSAGNAFYRDEKSGCWCFSPSSDTTVGFEYTLAYVTEFAIADRHTIKGFDRLYLGDGVTVPFTLANPYEDQRTMPVAGYNYKLVVFDFNPAYRYRLIAGVAGRNITVCDISQRMTSVTLPASEGKILGLSMLRTDGKSDTYIPMTEDWALYWGYIGERGEREVEVRVQTPAVRMSASAVKRFDDLYIEGAEAGMKFRLLQRTTVRPVFSASAGRGSTLSFADVAALDIRQIELLDALQQMFDLRFCTDETTKTVYIEPSAKFFAGTVVDWSGRVDRDAPIVTSDRSLAMHERVTLAYGEGDAAVARYNADNDTSLGRWSFIPDSQAVLSGEAVSLNPLFAPTVSAKGLLYGARSASVMQVRSSDNADGDAVFDNFTPRIVRYAGLQPLSNGELWGPFATKGRYPLAAFHHAADTAAGSFTLCFEERDGAEGLNSWHADRLQRQADDIEVTLWLHILPDEIAALRQCRGRGPSVRSRFILDIDGASPSALYNLRSIEGYDPARSTVRCTFTKIAQTL